MVLFYEKGKKENIQNYRPIRYLSAIYKMFTKILTTRLKMVLDSAQTREQAGFLSGFCTMHHIKAARELIVKHKKHNLSLCLAFIDYEKAFDFVYTAAVVQCLEDIHKYRSFLSIHQY